MKELLGIRELTGEEIIEILDLADEMKKRYIFGQEKCRDLEGKTVTTLFYENSTRTKTSFELAATLTGARVNSLDVATSSVQKGESLIDTGLTLDALQSDVVVIRHQASGAPLFLSKNIAAAVVNAGDGMREHPTQALLDFMTMREHFGDFKGLKVTIMGDVKHSRVARSNLWGLKKLGAEVTFCGPKTLLPAELSEHCRMTTNPEVAVAGADVVMGLRIQLERQQQGLFPSLREYNRKWGINNELLKKAADHAIVMHPGPVNRGVEINADVCDGKQSVINDQVTNGLAVRMAVLSLIAKER